MILISIAIFLLTLTGKLVIDRHQHLSRKKIDHGGEALIVAVLLTSTLFISGWASTVMFFLCFWALFDFCFGILIARNPFFLGTTSVLDRLQKKYVLLHAFKYLAAIGSIILYIYA